MGINKDMLVRRVFASDRMQNFEIRYNKLTMELIREIYEELENQVVKCLSEVDETNDSKHPVVVRLFEGVTISSFYKPPKETVLNFMKNTTDNTITAKGRVGIKTNVTRYLKEKLTKLNEEFRSNRNS